MEEEEKPEQERREETQAPAEEPSSPTTSGYGRKPPKLRPPPRRDSVSSPAHSVPQEEETRTQTPAEPEERKAEEGAVTDTTENEAEAEAVAENERPRTPTVEELEERVDEKKRLHSKLISIERRVDSVAAVKAKAALVRSEVDKMRKEVARFKALERTLANLQQTKDQFAKYIRLRTAHRRQTAATTSLIEQSIGELDEGTHALVTDVQARIDDILVISGTEEARERCCVTSNPFSSMRAVARDEDFGFNSLHGAYLNHTTKTKELETAQAEMEKTEIRAADAVRSRMASIQEQRVDVVSAWEKERESLVQELDRHHVHSNEIGWHSRRAVRSGSNAAEMSKSPARTWAAAATPPRIRSMSAASESASPPPRRKAAPSPKPEWESSPRRATPRGSPSRPRQDEVDPDYVLHEINHKIKTLQEELDELQEKKHRTAQDLDSALLTHERRKETIGRDIQAQKRDLEHEEGRTGRFRQRQEALKEKITALREDLVAINAANPIGRRESSMRVVSTARSPSPAYSPPPRERSPVNVRRDPSRLFSPTKSSSTRNATLSEERCERVSVRREMVDQRPQRGMSPVRAHRDSPQR